MTGHFEAKKHAYRQTQDGIVVSFVIHPNDLDAAFAVAALGTRYMVGFAEIGDDGKPVENIAARGRTPDVVTAPEQPGQTTGPASSGMPVKDRKPFTSLPLSQQAALKCGDKDFQQFMVERYAGPHSFRPTEDNAAILVRERCGVKSRAELNDERNDWPRQHWNEILGCFHDWMTDRQYADARR